MSLLDGLGSRRCAPTVRRPRRSCGSSAAPGRPRSARRSSSRRPTSRRGRLRGPAHRVFVEEQGIFAGTTATTSTTTRARSCSWPETARARSSAGSASPRLPVSRRRRGGRAGGELGWWVGSRLVVAPGAPPRTAALVRAACARAEAEGRCGSTRSSRPTRSGSSPTSAGSRGAGRAARPPPRADALADRPHRRAGGGQAGHRRGARRPAPRRRRLRGRRRRPRPRHRPGGGTDAILPSMVERDPWWAGWCSVLVNVNDLAAMGAARSGCSTRWPPPTPRWPSGCMAGLTDAAARYGVPVLGGHTQVGAPSALTVTMLGRAARPSPAAAGGRRPGQRDRRPGRRLARGLRGPPVGLHDRPLGRRPAALTSALGPGAGHAAKDVSMAGLVGTLGMLAEASGCGAELDVAAVPRPDEARLADWFTCFPGFALVAAGDRPVRTADAAPAAVATCGRLVRPAGRDAGVARRRAARVLDGPVVGLGRADQVRCRWPRGGCGPSGSAGRRPRPAWARVLTGPPAERGPGPPPPPAGRRGQRPPAGSPPGSLAHALGRDGSGPGRAPAPRRMRRPAAAGRPGVPLGGRGRHLRRRPVGPIAGQRGSPRVRRRALPQRGPGGPGRPPPDPRGGKGGEPDGRPEPMPAFPGPEPPVTDRGPCEEAGRSRSRNRHRRGRRPVRPGRRGRVRPDRAHPRRRPHPRARPGGPAGGGHRRLRRRPSRRRRAAAGARPRRARDPPPRRPGRRHGRVRGFCEAAGDVRYNAAVCVGGGEVLGRYRKVHQPLAEGSTYGAGDAFAAFDTPSAAWACSSAGTRASPRRPAPWRSTGASIIACLSAWPASRTNRARGSRTTAGPAASTCSTRHGRWTTRSCGVASNQTGSFGSLDRGPCQGRAVPAATSSPPRAGPRDGLGAGSTSTPSSPPTVPACATSATAAPTRTAWAPGTPAGAVTGAAV